MRLSHPSRVRGLKQANRFINEMKNAVAPFTGAWIETPFEKLENITCWVAPFTGAWIET